MTHDVPQQILQTIERKKHLLITTRADADGDALSGALAFYLLAQKLGKRVHLAIAGHSREQPRKCSFLPGYEVIKPKLEVNRETTVELEINTHELSALTYQTKNNKLLLKLFTDEKLTSLPSPRIWKNNYPYDLIVSVDAPELESLGEIFSEHTEFFYHTPIINIDHQPHNEHFGELNLVELTAVASTEVIFSLVESLHKDLIDEKLATCLLAGIIAESNSFQTTNITPRSLAIASELITRGAAREHIVEQLFHNKPVHLLQLCGRALAQLQHDEELGLIWCHIDEKDVEKQAQHTEFADVVTEMLSHVPQAKLAILLHPTDNYLTAIVKTNEHTLDLRKIFALLGPTGTRDHVTISHPSKHPEEAIARIKQQLINS
jgi:nanoRNase/pAp phosphatase (c-di-AMP/oligoRNAs hydrolase)